MLLLVLLAAQGLTILSIHRLITAHIVLGLLLLGPLAVKLASTGYRFLRYYSRDPDYARAGPPQIVLRVLAPIVVVTTVAVFASGIALLWGRPRRDRQMLLVHKLGFIIWFAVMTVHVLAYALPAARRSLDDIVGRGSSAVLASRKTRGLILAGCIVAGVALGLAGFRWAHPWAVGFAVSVS